jgi:hypothetical protein
LAITVRTAFGLPPQLSVLGAANGLPDLPAIGLALHTTGSDLSPARKFCLRGYPPPSPPPSRAASGPRKGTGIATLPAFRCA